MRLKALLVFLIIIPLLYACTSSASLITPSEAKALISSSEDVILLDVRTPSEYNQAHVPGAILLPLDDIQNDMKTLFPDQNSTYIIYCRSGNRSADAVKLLKDLGYQNLYDLGGIIDWPYPLSD